MDGEEEGHRVNQLQAVGQSGGADTTSPYPPFIFLGPAEETSTGCRTPNGLQSEIRLRGIAHVEIESTIRSREVLKKYNQVSLVGAPGEGKTETALTLCKEYFEKRYSVVFVEDVNSFDVDRCYDIKCNTLFVFDDIFGTISSSTNQTKLRSTLRAVESALKRSQLRGVPADQRPNADGEDMNTKSSQTPQMPRLEDRSYKVKVIFTSKTFNFESGKKNNSLYLVSLFKDETVVKFTGNLSKTSKSKLLSKYQDIYKQVDMTDSLRKKIIETDVLITGFPLACSMYFSEPAWQLLGEKFFKEPLYRLKASVNEIFSETSSRKGTLMLLVLCGGTLDLALFQKNREEATSKGIMESMEKLLPATDFSHVYRDARCFNGSLLQVIEGRVTFLHSTVYDAVACAMVEHCPLDLFRHCSLKFIFERIQFNKYLQEDTHVEDITNIVYVNQSGYQEIILNRLCEFILQGNFRLTFSHPMLKDSRIFQKILNKIVDNLDRITLLKDTDGGESFIYWCTFVHNNELLKSAIEKIKYSKRKKEEVVNSILACLENGNISALSLLVDLFDSESHVPFRVHAKKCFAITEAAKFGHIQIFDYILRSGLSLDTVDLDGKTCLHHASERGFVQIVALILKSKLDLIHQKDFCGRTPLLLSALSGHLEIFNILLEKGSDVTAKDYELNTCLHLASIKGYDAIVTKILTIDQSLLSKQGLIGRQPFMVAALMGKEETFNLLLGYSETLSVVLDDHGSNLLHMAAFGGSVNITKRALELLPPSECHRRNRFNRTPIQAAALLGNEDCFDLLLSTSQIAGVDVLGHTTLSMACLSGNIDLCKKLVNLQPKKLNSRSDSGITPLMSALKNGTKHLFELLERKGAKLDVKDNFGDDCLSLAVKFNNYDLVHHLLTTKHFRINRRGHKGCTPLMWAARFGNVEIFQMLRQFKADLTNVDNTNNDLLCSAFIGGNTDIINFLIFGQSECQFDINRPGENGRTPAMHGMFSGQRQVFNISLSQEADFKLRDDFGFNCLVLASIGGCYYTVKYLLSEKLFDVNSQAYDGTTALIGACRNGHKKVVKLLLEEGANPLIFDIIDNSGLGMAAFHPTSDIVPFLLSLKIFDVNHRNGVGDSPLLIATSTSRISTVIALLAHAADVSLINSIGNTFLEVAASVGSVSIVRYIKSHHHEMIDRKRQSIFRYSALMCAMAKGHTGVFDLLLQDDTDFSLRDTTGNSFLHIACRGGSVYILEKLLQRASFDINAPGGFESIIKIATKTLLLTDTDEKHAPPILVNVTRQVFSAFDLPPLMLLAYHGRLKGFNFLLEQGATTNVNHHNGLLLAAAGGNVQLVNKLRTEHDINSRGVFAWTPAMAASFKGKMMAFYHLKEVGADLALTDFEGDNCLQIAVAGCQSDLVQHILPLFDINAKGYKCMTAKMRAALAGDTCSYFALFHENKDMDISLTDCSGNSYLHLAAQGGSVAIIRHLLSLKKWDINHPGQYSRTPIAIAALYGHFGAYKYLFSLEADIETLDQDGDDCLTLAVHGKNKQIVEHLLKAKVWDLNIRGSSGMTSVMIACYHACGGIVRILYEAGADLTVFSGKDSCLTLAQNNGDSDIANWVQQKTKSSGHFPVDQRVVDAMIAAKNANYKSFLVAVKELKDSDIFQRDALGKDCLMYAAEGGDVEIVRYLLSRKIFKVNSVNSEGLTPLFEAAKAGHKDVFDLLLQNGAALEIPDSLNNCLHYAVSGGNIEILKCILAKDNVDIDSRGSKSWTALMSASASGKTLLFDLLAQKGANVNLRDQDDETCLSLACIGGHSLHVSHLLSLQNFNVNNKSKDGRTPLMYAAMKGSLRTFNELLSYMTDEDMLMTDNQGNDCLTFAIFSGNECIVEQLLQYEGERKFDVSRNGGRYLNVSAQRGQHRIFSKLVERGANVESLDQHGNNCLFNGVLGGSLHVVQDVVKMEVFDIDCLGKYGWTPLLASCSYGHRLIFDFLLQSGAKHGVLDEDGDGCLHLACANKHYGLLIYLLSLGLFDINCKGKDGKTPAMYSASKGDARSFFALTSLLDAKDLFQPAETWLTLAVQGGNVDILKYILNKNTSLERQVHDRLIQLALQHGNQGSFESLLTVGFAIPMNNTVIVLIYHSAITGCAKALEYLYQFKPVEIEPLSPMSWTPVMVACYYGHFDACKILMTKDDVTKTDVKGNNLLLLACMQNHDKLVKYILSLKLFDLNYKRNDGRTAIMIAAANGNVSCFFHLILNEDEVDTTLTDSKGFNCLTLAALSNNVDIVRYLIQIRGMDINIEGQNLWTPIMVAARFGKERTFAFLLKEGADLKRIDFLENNILLLAALGGNVHIVQYFIDQSLFPVDCTGHSSMTPLMFASVEGNIEVFNLLISHGADINQVDKDRLNCLHIACKYNELEMVKHLLPLFGINKKELNLQTPVMTSAQYGHKAIFDYLVKEGADLRVSECENNCLILAAQGGNVQIVEYLLSVGLFNINCQGQYLLTPLMMASAHGHKEVFDFLLGRGGDPSAVGREGEGCLHVASICNRAEMVKHILDSGLLNIDSQDNFGRSPLMLAAECGREETFFLLVNEGANCTLTDFKNVPCAEYANKGENAKIIQHFLQC